MGEFSAGILMWRRADRGVEVLLAHFGGPYWAKRDAGAWAIPKGLIEDGEDAETCAQREFEEELGVKPNGLLIPLGRIRQKGGKWVHAFALEGDLDPAVVRSNDFTVEWPPKSRRFQAFPEIDRADWFALAEAREKILPSQVQVLEVFEALEVANGDEEAMADEIARYVSEHPDACDTIAGITTWWLATHIRANATAVEPALQRLEKAGVIDRIETPSGTLWRATRTPPPEAP